MAVPSDLIPSRDRGDNPTALPPQVVHRVLRLLDAADSAADQPETLGKYRLIREIGRGGMGVVYEAEDTELRRRVALKLLSEDHPAAIARFHREIHAVSALSHPHIAAVYDAGELDGRRFIALQYVDGQTLTHFVGRDPRLLVRLVRDACLAVQSAHEAGIVHRDLKPQNLMAQWIDAGTADREPSAHVYVLDFGLAKHESVDVSLSVTGMLLGTPAYMPPEQARGEPEAVGPRSDVYALGATLYHLLTGQPPYTGKTLVELLRRVQAGDILPPRRLNPKIEPELEAVVLHCLEADPAARYGSAADLAQDLTRWLAGQPTLARPLSLGARVRKHLRRHRRLCAEVAIGLTVLVTLAGWATVSIMRARCDTFNAVGIEFRRNGEESEDRGEDAAPHFDRARQSFERACATLRWFSCTPEFAQGTYKNLANALLGRARAEARAGRDARDSFRSALAALNTALEFYPDSDEALLSRGRALHGLALAQGVAGEPAADAFRQAIAAYTDADAMRRRLAGYGYGEALRRRAEVRISAAEVPGTPVAAAAEAQAAARDDYRAAIAAYDAQGRADPEYRGEADRQMARIRTLLGE